jgi:hypothetical protein
MRINDLEREGDPAAYARPGLSHNRSSADPTFADAILDRLVYNAHRLTLRWAIDARSSLAEYSVSTDL